MPVFLMKKTLSAVQKYKRKMQKVRIDQRDKSLKIEKSTKYFQIL
jgi:hypothetical protein